MLRNTLIFSEGDGLSTYSSVTLEVIELEIKWTAWSIRYRIHGIAQNQSGCEQVENEESSRSVHH